MFACVVSDREHGKSVAQYDWEYSKRGMDFLSYGGYACDPQLVLKLFEADLHKDSCAHGVVHVALGAPSPRTRLLFLDIDQPGNLLEIADQLDGQYGAGVGQRSEPDDF